MKMRIGNPLILLLLLGLLAVRESRADAVLRPSDSAYPGPLLRHTVTEVEVDIHGLAAETRAYSEFRNDWDQPVDAVYSFPLPPDAHVTRLWYSRGDTVFEAQLKEVPQSTLPGRGEGGFAAELEAYLGKNKVSLQLKAIRPGGTQRVEVRYVQRLQLMDGRIAYRMPLDTKGFQFQALSHLGVNVNLRNPWASQSAPSWKSESHPEGWKVLDDGTDLLSIRFDAPKAFLDRDFTFSYAPAISDYGFAMQSYRKPDSAGFMLASLVARPPAEATPKPRAVLFLLDKSRSMSGFKLQQSAEAVKACLSLLASGDEFAIATFDYAFSLSIPFQPATSSSIAAALAMLDSLGKAIGLGATHLPNGLNKAFQSFPSGSMAPQLYLFADGFTQFKPEDIRNDGGIPVFAFGLGKDVNRARLDAVATSNRGLALFLDEEDDILGKAKALFTSAATPALTSATLQGPAGSISDVAPAGSPATLFGWGGLVMAGRFNTPGNTLFTLRGEGDAGPVTKTFSGVLASDTSNAEDGISKRFWAAEKIRQLQDRIDIHGMDDGLRKEIVRISLLHKVKSRYTSYRADYESVPAEPVPGGLPALALPDSREPSFRNLLLASRMPGHAEATIQVEIGPEAAVGETMVAVYDMRGRLIRLLLKKRMQAGRHLLYWDGRDAAGRLVNAAVLVVVRSGGRVQSQILQAR